jgi:curved DNA-binding protein CbpA
MNYYEILGVTTSATLNEIKIAFRRLAMQYHPDVNPSPDAKQTFQLIYIAYEVLSDGHKRNIYNQRLAGHNEDVNREEQIREWRKKAQREARQAEEVRYAEYEKKLHIKLRNRTLSLIMVFLLMLLAFMSIQFGLNLMKSGDIFSGYYALIALSFVLAGVCMFAGIQAFNGFFPIFNKKEDSFEDSNQIE